MDTTFLNYLLVFTLCIILILYLYQVLPQTTTIKNNNNDTKKEKFLPIIFDTCPNGRKMGMPVHRVGPIHNFHQSFNKYIPTIQNNYTTGIPEMGWRNYYLKKYNQNQIKYEDPFAGTTIRNFLNNMDNVDNIYRKC